MKTIAKVVAQAIFLFAYVATGSSIAQDLPFQSDPRRIAELEAAASSVPPEAGSPLDQCVFFHKRGMALADLGRYEDAVVDLKKALSLNSPQVFSNDWCSRARIQNDLSFAILDLGDHFARIEMLLAFSAEAQAVNASQYFSNQLRLIDSYAPLAMLKEAQDAFDRATATLPALRQRNDWRTEQHNIMDRHSRYAARLQEMRGNLDEGERLRRLAYQNAQEYERLKRTNNPRDSWIMRIASGNVTSSMRQLAGALAFKGKLGQAEQLAKEALRLMLERQSINTIDASYTLNTIGGIRAQQGTLVEATRYAEFALMAMKGAVVKPYSRALAGTLDRVGLFYCMQRRWPDALRIYEERDRGLRTSVEEFAKRGSRTIDWAKALLETGAGGKAVEMLQVILNFNLQKAIVTPSYVAYVRGYLGAALASQGRLQEALSQFEIAVPALLGESQEGADDEDSSFYQSYRLRVVLESYLELLAKLAESGDEASKARRVSEGFKIADVARGSSVQRAVTASAARASIPNAELSALARREQDVKSRIQALNKVLLRLASAADDKRLEKIIGDMQRDIKSLSTDRVKLRQEISSRFPEYANLVDPKPPSIPEVQTALADGEVFVSTYSGERQTYVWTLTNKAARFRVVKTGMAELGKYVGRILGSVDLSSGMVKPFDLDASSSLYELLLAPDASVLANARQINWVPHGPLGSLPLGLLLTEPVATGRSGQTNYGEMPWLIKKLAVAQQSSANGFVTLRKSEPTKNPRKPFLGFGDPLFSLNAAQGSQRGSKIRGVPASALKDDTLEKLERRQALTKVSTDASEPANTRAFTKLPALPDTAEELKEIAEIAGANLREDVLLGKDATEAKVKSTALADFRVVAFATHGLLSGELSGLDQPALALANPALTGDAQNDGFLTLQEILGLKLNADWVILSACNTASDDGSGAEAVSGLGRAFFFAGTRSLLVSHWAVETVSARLLTTGIFRHQKSTAEASRAESLRQSVLTLMQSKFPIDYGHPAFWAPFSLVGEGLKN